MKVCLVFKKLHISYNQVNSNELQIFVDAIKKAKKMDGVVDVLAPDYLLTLILKIKRFLKCTSLWLGDNRRLSVSMNENDSNTMYIVQSGVNC